MISSKRKKLTPLACFSVLVCLSVFASLQRSSTSIVDAIRVSETDRLGQAVGLLAEKLHWRSSSEAQDVALGTDGASNGLGDEAAKLAAQLGELSAVRSGISEAVEEVLHHARDSDLIHGFREIATKLPDGPHKAEFTRWENSKGVLNASDFEQILRQFVDEFPVDGRTHGEAALILEVDEAIRLATGTRMTNILKEPLPSNLPVESSRLSARSSGLEESEGRRRILQVNQATPPSSPVSSGPASSPESPSTSNGSSKKSSIVAVAVAIPITAAVCIAFGLCFFYLYRRKWKARLKGGGSSDDGSPAVGQVGGGRKENDNRPLLNTSWLSLWSEAKKADATVFSVDAIPSSKKSPSFKKSKNKYQDPRMENSISSLERKQKQQQQGTTGLLDASPGESWKKLYSAFSNVALHDDDDLYASQPEQPAQPMQTTTFFSPANTRVSVDVRVSIDSGHGTPPAPPKRPPPALPPLAPSVEQVLLPFSQPPLQESPIATYSPPPPSRSANAPPPPSRSANAPPPPPPPPRPAAGIYVEVLPPAAPPPPPPPPSPPLGVKMGAPPPPPPPPPPGGRMGGPPPPPPPPLGGRMGGPPPPPPPPPGGRMGGPPPPPPPPPPGGRMGGPPPPPPPPPGGRMGGPPPPPPPPGGKLGGPPPPPPPPGARMGGPPPPPPPPGGRMGGPPPPPPPGKGGPKPPPPPPGVSPLRLPGGNFSLKPSSSRVVGRSGSGRVTNPPPMMPEPVDSKKLKPLHWDKVKPRREQETVWNNLLNGSFELDAHQMEALFQYLPPNQTKVNVPKAGAPVKEMPKTIIEARKAHNISIQLRGLGLTTDEVCESLLEGDETIPTEVLEKLSKMTLSDDEEWKIRDFKGKRSELGPAEKFLKTLLEIPHAFQRINTMLFRATFKDDLLQLEEAITVLEKACKELKGSRTFVKLLEAVLKTGNRLNMGTFRGDAQAFKLETLLKLADIKGTDGKISLLHFVIQEIIRAEGGRAARLASEESPRNSTPGSPTSACSTPASARVLTGSGIVGALYAKQEEGKNDASGKLNEISSSKHLYLKVVTGLSSELSNVKRAAGLDAEALALSMAKLTEGLKTCRTGLRKYFKSPDGGGSLSLGGSVEIDNYELSSDKFIDSMMSFVKKAETDVAKVQTELNAVFENVKSVGIYFYGDLRKDDSPLKVFQVVKDFLIILDRVCKEVATQVQIQNKKPNVVIPHPPIPRG